MRHIAAILCILALLAMCGCEMPWDSTTKHGTHVSTYLARPTLTTGGTLILDDAGKIVYDSLVLWKYVPFDAAAGHGTVVIGWGSVIPENRAFTLDPATGRYTYHSTGRIGLWFDATGACTPATTWSVYEGIGYDSPTVTPYDWTQDPQARPMARYMPPHGEIRVDVGGSDVGGCKTIIRY